MGIPTFRKVRSPDENLMTVQDQASALNRALSQIALLNGNLIENVAITSGTPKNVQHLLDRVPTGYLITKKSAESTIWDSESDVPKRTLVLNASASCTVSVWVF